MGEKIDDLLKYCLENIPGFKFCFEAEQLVKNISNINNYRIAAKTWVNYGKQTNTVNSIHRMEYNDIIEGRDIALGIVLRRTKKKYEDFLFDQREKCLI